MSQAKTIAACVMCLTAVLPVSHAQEKRSVPDSLFGIRLGGVFVIGETENPTDVGTLPIKEYKAAEKFLGSGFNLYFKPLKEYPAFEYSENPKKPGDKFFSTSFRIYLLPVFPKDALTRKGLRGADLKWEATQIEWSQREKKKDEAYYWAFDFCKTLQVDLAKKPEVYNSYETKLHSCKFIEKDRELYVFNLGELKIFRLAYPESVFKQKDYAVDTIMRKLRMKEIRPY